MKVPIVSFLASVYFFHFYAESETRKYAIVTASLFRISFLVAKYSDYNIIVTKYNDFKLFICIATTFQFKKILSTFSLVPAEKVKM